ncbi:hypothetical protein LTR08_006820 [Meristemomyces frigidus]|nr:hypothetical protein LTR08_006820 [Meristemomyces frigidus]
MAAINKPGFLGTDTQYHSVSSVTQSNDHESEEQTFEPKLELGEHPQVSTNRSWLMTIVLQFLSLLWLVPIMALLILNLKGHVIGASAWCPGGRCWVQAHNPNTSIPESKIRKFDKQNHNLLGILQLVAKALEIWFEIIAAALVYIVTMLLAGRDEGMPVGYLTRPSEFADMPGLFDPLLWTSLPRRRHQGAYNTRAARFRIWIFIMTTLALCILCNLMGPATAVLAIPSLQWLDTRKFGSGRFSFLNSAAPPSTKGFAAIDQFTTGNGSSVCSNAAFEAQNYSCTAFDWADKLDAWVTAYVASAAEGSFSTVTYEDSLTFTFNASSGGSQASDNEPIYWVPNRQVVKTFNDDATIISYMSAGYNATGLNFATSLYEVNTLNITEDIFDSYTPYNSSLLLQVQRYGPILGSYHNNWTDNTGKSSWTTTVDSSRALQCFANYTFGFTDDTPYLKCVQDGVGWGPNTKYASFTVEGAYNTQSESVGPSVTYEIFSSDRVAFLVNGKLPSGVAEDCLVNGTVPAGTECDWDAIFDAPGPIANISNNVTTLRMTMNSGQEVAILAVDFVAYTAFTEYTLDPSALTNPLLLVQVQSIPEIMNAVALNPAWTLAAWSVDNGGTLPANRTVATDLLNVMQSILDNTINDDADMYYQLMAITAIPMLQTLSLVDYEITDYNTDKITKALLDDKTHPVLYRNANMYVWAYGISSRTAYLGLAVTILGCAVVLTQFVLGLVTRKRYRSPTQLLVAALEHAPKGEFDGREHDEPEMARVRFHMQDASHTAGKLSFRHPL